MCLKYKKIFIAKCYWVGVERVSRAKMYVRKEKYFRSCVCTWSGFLHYTHIYMPGHLLYYKKVNRVLKMKSFSYLRQVVNEETEITLDGVM